MDDLLRAVKFVDGPEGMIGGLAIPFGGPIRGGDLEGESFGPDTDFVLDLFPDGRPILFHHGLDSAVRTEVIGRQTDVAMDDEGLWIRAQLDKRSRWYARVKKLIDEAAVGFSSGALAHLVQTRKDGRITRWPWVEASLTPTPAHPGAVVYAVKADPASVFEDSEDEDTREAIAGLETELLVSELRRHGVAV